MTVENAVLENIKKLPAEKKQEVLDFAEFLVQKNEPKKPRRSLKGALADLNIHITEEDIREARREMWGGYMKEDFE
ncbi:MAG: DUF2281 domain-containing protein [Acidobacteriota bacterium]|nr:DUF2281 domain-containing protein [Acidobacteriota bacterium]